MQLKQFYNIATKVSSRKKCYYFWWSTWLLSSGTQTARQFKADRPIEDIQKDKDGEVGTRHTLNQKWKQYYVHDTWLIINILIY